MDEAVALIRDLLAYEEDSAVVRGLVDCTCVNRSERFERLYEDGRCPHQRARAYLARAGTQKNP